MFVKKLAACIGAVIEFSFAQIFKGENKLFNRNKKEYGNVLIFESIKN